MFICPHVCWFSSGISLLLPLRTLFPMFSLNFPPCHVFFLSSLHWRQSWRQWFMVILWFPHAAFIYVGCCLFLDIKCLWVNLVCPIWSIFSLTSYCLQLLWALSHSSIQGLICFSLLVLFFHSLCHSSSVYHRIHWTSDQFLNIYSFFPIYFTFFSFSDLLFTSIIS